MAADAEATLPALIEAVKSAIPNDRKAAIEKRGEAAKKAHAEAQRAHQAGGGARLGREPDQHGAPGHGDLWRRSRTSTGRWSRQSGNVSDWPHRLWPMEKHYHWLGASGGYGVGYGAPAAVGAALANRDLGRFSVSIQGDGDLMYAPGVLWTAAKHKIPLLVGDAQQPRLSPGGDARAAAVELPQPRGKPRRRHGSDRHQHR